MELTRPWLKNFPAGLPANVDVDRYQNILELADEAFKKFKNKVAFHCMGKDLTYAQLDTLSTHFGAYLLSRGLERGDKIALMMPNLLQYPIAIFGALKAGLVIVNTNPLYTPREMEHQFRDSGVKAIVICENFAHNLQKVLPKTDIKVVITTSIGEMLGFFKGALVNFVIRKVKHMVPAYTIPNTVVFKDALNQGKKFKLAEASAKPDDVAFLQYTGGTTGLSKGAMLTHRNILANVIQVRVIMAQVLKEGEEIALNPLPLYHIFALTVNCLALSTYGINNILIVNPRELKSIVKEFKKHKITLMTGVNTLFNGLANFKDFQDCDFSDLRLSVAGGMAVQRAVAEKWQKVTGCYLSEGYGMTESSPVASINPLDKNARIGTIGLPLPSTDMRIVNDEGSPLNIGEVGEIQIKGPQVMKGYYNRPEETSKVLNDGWLSTGDIGLMDEDGFFKIVDRKKDMILVSGFNVYPNEIEDAACLHPNILEAAAIGVEDPKSTEAIKLFIVTDGTNLTEDQVKTHCREHLTGYKIPKYVITRKELPKTNVGKILRRALKEEEVKSS